ncbi:MAG: hypothetical protein Q9198_011151 [Flavoplaca austrocitrina]
MESVTFPLTWNDMCEHGALIKWFLENHNLNDFIHAPNEHYFFGDNDDTGSGSGNLSPTSKAAHMSPHDNCDYCIELARADKIPVYASGWANEYLTFPLTMDDMLEHKDSILAYLPNWSKNAFIHGGIPTPLAGQDIHFDEDVRLTKDTVEAWT